MPRTNFEQLRVYQFSEELSDAIWNIVCKWDGFARDTVGKQVVRSAGLGWCKYSEGEGRDSYQDNRRFIKIARGSLQETQHWLRRAFKRNLLTDDQIKTLRPLTDKLSPSLSAYLRSIGTKGVETKD